MGKRYYCDFCDRSFADSGVNRKNHFKGSIHQRLRKQHYDSFRDASTILSEEALKLPCTRFLNGTCDYGDSCKFSHMTIDKKRQLEAQINHENELKRKQQEQEKSIPSLEDWLAKRRKTGKQETSGQTTSESDVHYELPPFLACIPNLPPSLLPPTAEELKNPSKNDWG